MLVVPVTSMLFGVDNDAANHSFRRGNAKITGIGRDPVFRFAIAFLYAGSITANRYGKSAIAGASKRIGLEPIHRPKHSFHFPCSLLEQIQQLLCTFSRILPDYHFHILVNPIYVVSGPQFSGGRRSEEHTSELQSHSF